MNPKTMSKEEVKNGLQEGTLKELDDLAEQATGQSAYSPPFDSVVNGTKKEQAILKVCQK